MVEHFSTGFCCRGCSAIHARAGVAAEGLRKKVGMMGESVRGDGGILDFEHIPRKRV
jgi:hypothetical protein